MMNYPQIDPVALSLGPLKVHWYGLMYLVGFLAFFLLGKYRARRDDYTIKPHEVSDMLFYVALGVILGGRIGYILFYGFADVLADPISIFRVWEGGMSFHGGLIGVLIAMALYARKLGTGFFNLADFAAPMVPIGLMTGRIGNFINGELWGRPTDGPWGMVFPHVDAVPRHASQLYEAGLEGLILFLLLWVYSSRPRKLGAVSGVFMVGYGLFRFIVEFAREPDSHLGFLLLDWMTMGQILCVPMVIAGVIIFLWSKSNPQPVKTA